MFLNCNPNVTWLHLLEIIGLACYLFLGTIRTSINLFAVDIAVLVIFLQRVFCILPTIIAFLVYRFSVCIYEFILVCIYLCIWIRSFLHACYFGALPLLLSPMYVQCVITWHATGEKNVWGQKSCLLHIMSQFLLVSIGSRSELIPLTGRQNNIKLMFQSESSIFFTGERAEFLWNGMWLLAAESPKHIINGITPWCRPKKNRRLFSS